MLRLVVTVCGSAVCQQFKLAVYKSQEGYFNSLQCANNYYSEFCVEFECA